MRGGISISEFIHRVKDELVHAQVKNGGEPFYRLTEVELEISFVLGASGKAKGSLMVLEASTEAKAQQSHKVTLKLEPVFLDSLRSKPAEPESSETNHGGDGGGVGVVEEQFAKKRFGPVYEYPPDPFKKDLL